MSRFAPITAGLLVRKGEARPWTMPGALDYASEAAPRYQPPQETPAARAERQAAETVEERPRPPLRLAKAGGGEPPGAAPKRCTLKLSHTAYERLGIVAVKTDKTRQQILRDAIETYLDAAAKEFRSSCGCLGGTCRGDC